MIKVRIKVFDLCIIVILLTHTFPNYWHIYTSCDMSNNIYLLWHEQHQLHLIPLLTWVLLCTNHNKSYKPYLWKFVLKLNCIPNLLLKKLYHVKDLLSKLDRSSTIILISRLPVNFPNKAISPSGAVDHPPTQNIIIFCN